MQQKMKAHKFELRSTDSRRISGNIAADHPYEKSPGNNKSGFGEALGGEAGFKTRSTALIAETYLYLVELEGGPARGL